MPWNPTSWFVASRVRAPHERPREYNDPGKAHELADSYDHALWPNRLKIAASLVILLVILAFIGFIVYNLVFG